LRKKGSNAALKKEGRAKGRNMKKPQFFCPNSRILGVPHAKSLKGEALCGMRFYQSPPSKRTCCCFPVVEFPRMLCEV